MVQQALEALPGVGLGNVLVSPQSTATSFTIRFVGTLMGGKMPKLTVNQYATTGGNITASVVNPADTNGGLTINSNLTSTASVRKDRRGKRILPFCRIGGRVKYNLETVRAALAAIEEGGPAARAATTRPRAPRPRN